MNQVEVGYRLARLLGHGWAGATCPASMDDAVEQSRVADEADYGIVQAGTDEAGDWRHVSASGTIRYEIFAEDEDDAGQARFRVMVCEYHPDHSPLSGRVAARSPKVAEAIAAASYAAALDDAGTCACIKPADGGLKLIPTAVYEHGEWTIAGHPASDDAGKLVCENGEYWGGRPLIECAAYGTLVWVRSISEALGLQTPACAQGATHATTKAATNEW